MTARCGDRVVSLVSLSRVYIHRRRGRCAIECIPREDNKPSSIVGRTQQLTWSLHVMSSCTSNTVAAVPHRALSSLQS